jgi:hypothetical protein
MFMHPQLKTGESITIGGVQFTVAEHPMAPGIPFGQEGRQGIVYQLITQDGSRSGKKALKVFREQFRDPKLKSLSEHLKAYTGLPGLMVCDRTVIVPEEHGDLLSRHPELIYGTVMPWVEGPTWMDVMLDKRELSEQDSFHVARSLIEVLFSMEQRGLAHCDLSGANVLLPKLADQPEGAFADVEFVDIEQMYAPKLEKSEITTGASPGYAGENISDDLWSPHADRFAGAILIAEMLGWCDGTVRGHAWGESYFAPEEIQKKSTRYDVLLHSIRKHFGDQVAKLFERAWESIRLEQCPSFAEWLAALPKRESIEIIHPEKKPELGEKKEVTATEKRTVPSAEKPVLKEISEMKDLDTYLAQLKNAGELEQKGELKEALKLYRQVLQALPPGHGMAQDVAMIIPGLEEKIREQTRQTRIAFLKKLLFKPSYKWWTAAVILGLAVVGFVVGNHIFFWAEAKTGKNALLPQSTASRSQQPVAKPPLQPGEKAGSHVTAEKGNPESKTAENGPMNNIVVVLPAGKQQETQPTGSQKRTQQSASHSTQKNDKTVQSKEPASSKSYVIRTSNLPPTESQYSALKKVELSPGNHPIGYLTSARLPITNEYLLGIFVANEGKYPIRWELDDRNANTRNLSGTIYPGGPRVNQRMQVVPADYVLYLYCIDSKACEAVGEISSWKIK